MLSKLLKQVLVILTSVIETITAAGTFALRVAGSALGLVYGLQVIGFALEHIVSYIRANGFVGLGGALLRILVIAVLETVSWFGLIEGVILGGSQVLMGDPVQGILALIIGGGVFYIGLRVGHALEQNTVRRCPRFVNALFRGETNDITLIEFLTGIVWIVLAILGISDPALAITAVVVLFGGLEGEHEISVRKDPVCYP